MFTGLIEEIGELAEIRRGAKSAILRINAKTVLEDVKIGDSISVNGICLTVTTFDQGSFTVDVMPETLQRSNLGDMQKNSKVNLERAMIMNGRFGGHIVSGHIDGTGKILTKTMDDNAVRVRIAAGRELLKYIVQKGSVALDGISLTVANASMDWFEVSIIPLTGADTTLLDKSPGDKINIECDQLGKYVERLLQFQDAKSVMDFDYLMENGF